MSITHINPDGMMKSPAFSQAIMTEGSGKAIYIGGQNAVNEKGETVGKGDIIAQTGHIMKNIGTLLESVGGTYQNLIKLTIYFKRRKDVQAAFETSQKYIPQNGRSPIVTALFVAAIGNDDYLLEIDAIAFIPDKA